MVLTTELRKRESADINQLMDGLIKCGSFFKDKGRETHIFPKTHQSQFRGLLNQFFQKSSEQNLRF